jgi:hypothetical protein
MTRTRSHKDTGKIETNTPPGSDISVVNEQSNQFFISEENTHTDSERELADILNTPIGSAHYHANTNVQLPNAKASGVNTEVKRKPDDALFNEVKGDAKQLNNPNAKSVVCSRDTISDGLKEQSNLPYMPAKKKRNMEKTRKGIDLHESEKPPKPEDDALTITPGDYLLFKKMEVNALRREGSADVLKLLHVESLTSDLTGLQGHEWDKGRMSLFKPTTYTFETLRRKCKEFKLFNATLIPVDLSDLSLLKNCSCEAQSFDQIWYAHSQQATDLAGMLIGHYNFMTSKRQYRLELEKVEHYCDPVRFLAIDQFDRYVKERYKCCGFDDSIKYDTTPTKAHAVVHHDQHPVVRLLNVRSRPTTTDIAHDNHIGTCPKCNTSLWKLKTFDFYVDMKKEYNSQQMYAIRKELRKHWTVCPKREESLSFWQLHTESTLTGVCNIKDLVHKLFTKATEALAYTVHDINNVETLKACIKAVCTLALDMGTCSSYRTIETIKSAVRNDSKKKGNDQVEAVGTLHEIITIWITAMSKALLEYEYKQWYEPREYVKFLYKSHGSHSFVYKNPEDLVQVIQSLGDGFPEEAIEIKKKLDKLLPLEFNIYNVMHMFDTLVRYGERAALLLELNRTLDDVNEEILDKCEKKIEEKYIFNPFHSDYFSALITMKHQNDLDQFESIPIIDASHRKIFFRRLFVQRAQVITGEQFIMELEKGQYQNDERIYNGDHYTHNSKWFDKNGSSAFNVFNLMQNFFRSGLLWKNPIAPVLDLEDKNLPDWNIEISTGVQIKKK